MALELPTKIPERVLVYQGLKEKLGRYFGNQIFWLYIQEVILDAFSKDDSLTRSDRFIQIYPREITGIDWETITYRMINMTTYIRFSEFQAILREIYTQVKEGNQSLDSELN